MKKEVSFNTYDNNADCENGMITYNDKAGKPDENSVKNKAGLNNFYSATTTPAYAYSYLLTSVVSEDYVDVSANGPTPDDMGSYTRFNYTRVHKNYKWRSPMAKTRLNYRKTITVWIKTIWQTMFMVEKVWYLNSIETRNYVAKFIVSNRDDALGVKDENGGKDSNQKLKKLSRIELSQEPIEKEWTKCNTIQNRTF
ncbi:MAG: hypothetical protein U5L09_15040 [Bacteroidales bacterium]|nr:hypothetical protein [Bacteroidales bacterium]